MDTTTLLVAAAIVVVIAVVLIVATAKARRRSRLRERFGPEYDRTVERADSRRDGERDLRHREEQHDELELRDLSDAERDRYVRQWESVQQSFVDRPGDAVRNADMLVGAVMRDRGYPVDDFDTKADIVSVDHPEIVHHYRAAHAVSSRDGAETETEDQREAFVHYRALFDELVGSSHRVR